jgi:RHS repeat-associated protein
MTSVAPPPPPPPIPPSNRFSSTANDGRIQTRTDHVSGETVEYQYDQLGRLLSAATQGAGGWGLAWNHDGFGNLTQQSVTKGSLTGFTHSVNGTTNRINGQYYDANGNWGGSFGQWQSYDIDNRIHTAAGPQFMETYLYSARNERMVSQRGQDRHRVHFYGADGLLLGIYSLDLPLSGPNETNPSYTYPVRLADQERIYFGGRLLQIGGEWVATDRLGSVVRKGTTNYKYAPYGQEIGGATPNDTNKFATYTRDSLSGLDYALNRYYKPEWGRFTSPDPYTGSAKLQSPLSWNRYTYTGGDPVNYLDPTGLFAISVPDFEQIAWSNILGVFYVLHMLVPDLTGYEPPSEEDVKPPPLECTFVRATVEKPGFLRRSEDRGRQYMMPITFHFSASGGTGDYTWTNTQRYSVTGYVTYSNGAMLREDGTPGTENLIFLGASTGPRVRIWDAPGLHEGHEKMPGARVVLAHLDYKFSLTASVSSGGETVVCPEVRWSGTLHWETTGKKLRSTRVTGRVRLGH